MARDTEQAHGRRWSTAVGVAAITALALAASGCGKTSASSNSSTTSSGSAAAASTTQAAAASTGTGCGEVPKIAFKDVSGVIKQLGARYESAYNGFPSTIYPSPWAHFKPHGKAPYTIGVSLTQPINSFQGQTAALLAADLHRIKGVGKVTVLTSPPTGLTTQIQQVNQLIQQKVDVIVAEPLVAPAFSAVAVKAAKAGIPFVSLVNSTPVPPAINVVPNTVADSLGAGATLTKLIGGKGTIIGVHGIESTAGDQQAFAAFKRVFGACPGIKFASSLVGDFQVPVAKQQVLAYLSAHPQPVAGAVETAEMASGIIQAFQQSGRPEPAIADAGPSLGDLAYWSAHKSTFKAVGGTLPAKDLARATAYTVSHLLAGQGPKVSQISAPSPVINAANLAQWAKPGASVGDATAVEGPANAWLPDSYLAPLFNK